MNFAAVVPVSARNSSDGSLIVVLKYDVFVFFFFYVVPTNI